MKSLKLILLFLICFQITKAQISIDTVNVSLGEPNELYVGGIMADLSIERVEIKSLEDSLNTFKVSIYFDGCPISQVLVEYDTVIKFNSSTPFRVSIYTIHDTSLNCNAPQSPVFTDSLFMINDQIVSIKENKLSDNKIKINYQSTNNTINLSVDPSITIQHIVLSDVFGKVVSMNDNNNSNLILNNLSTGLYFLTFYCNEGVLTKKIIVK